MKTTPEIDALAGSEREARAIGYAVARELFNTRIAECSARIGEEQEKPTPDTALIDALRQEQLAIALEQRDLRSDSPAEVAAAIRWHRVALARQQARYWDESP